MLAEKLTISVENHPPEFAEVLEEKRLVYRVYRSSRRWVYLTDFLPGPVAGATAQFLQRTVLPELFLDYLDRTYHSVSNEDRLAVFRDNLPYFESERFTLGTQAIVQPSLEEQRGLSIEGWLRFRGQTFFETLVAGLAREGLKALRLERAYHQFRSLADRPTKFLRIEGQGEGLVVRDDTGQEVYWEYLEGHLDPRLNIDREDLALSLVRALQPEELEVAGVSDEFRGRLRGLRPQGREG